MAPLFNSEKSRRKRIERLLRDLSNGDGGKRAQAAEVLGETSDAGMISHLLPLLHDERFTARVAAARALGTLRDHGKRMG